MSNMFLAVSNFNADISEWKVNKVDSINRMFYNATAFDKNLDAWKEHFTLDTAGKAIATKANAQIALDKDEAFLGSKLAVAGQEPTWY